MRTSPESAEPERREHRHSCEEDRRRGGRAGGEGAVYTERGTSGRVATLGWQRGELGGLALGQSPEGQGPQPGLRTQDGAGRMVPPRFIHGTDSTAGPRAP